MIKRRYIVVAVTVAVPLVGGSLVLWLKASPPIQAAANEPALPAEPLEPEMELDLTKFTPEERQRLIDLPACVRRAGQTADEDFDLFVSCLRGEPGGQKP